MPLEGGTAGSRVATIVVTDVNRFSTLMKRDAATTLAMLTSLHHEVVDPLASRQGGRFFGELQPLKARAQWGSTLRLRRVPDLG